MRRLFDLGSIPAAALQRTLEDSFGVKVFIEPLEGSQSGACVRSDFGAGVLLNGADAPWRRNFSLAHELFHLVTWDAIETAWERGPRNEAGEPAWYAQLERFANHFASHILLPAETLLARVHGQAKEGRITYHQVATIARDFEVSVQALLYRLCGLGVLERSTVDAAVNSAELKNVSREVLSPLKRDDERWFPERFFNLAARAYQRGVIGKSVIAKFLEMPYAELETFDLGEPHGSEASLSLT
jgi:Zn-dependent peptidase ImmA (M78 family)